MSSTGTQSTDVASPRRSPWTSGRGIGRRRTGARVEAEARVAGPPTGEGWTRTEIAGFKRSHGTHTDEELALRFARNVKEIRALARELRLSKDKAFVKRLCGKGATRMPRWREEEIELLRDLYPARRNLELASQLGRSAASVVTKAHYLKLKKSDQRLQEMGRENVSVRYAMALEPTALQRPPGQSIGLR